MNEEFEEYWEDEYLDEEEIWEEEDTGCTIPHPPDEVCPECCSFGGWYSPGTEECDFCIHSDFCREVWERMMKKGGRF